MADNVQAIFDGKAAEEFLTKLQDKIKKTKNADRKLLGILTGPAFRNVTSHFEQEEGSDGPWTPWSDMYAEHMDKIGKGGNKILQNSSRLKGSFVPALSQRPGEFRWINPAQTKEGFPYAYAHNEGGGRLPKRDFMYLDDEAVENIARQCLNFILDED